MFLLRLLNVYELHLQYKNKGSFRFRLCGIISRWNNMLQIYCWQGSGDFILWSVMMEKPKWLFNLPTLSRSGITDGILGIAVLPTWLFIRCAWNQFRTAYSDDSIIILKAVMMALLRKPNIFAFMHLSTYVIHNRKKWTAVDLEPRFGSHCPSVNHYYFQLGLSFQLKVKISYVEYRFNNQAN